MVNLIRHKRKVSMVAALLVALLIIAGCSEIQPYNPPNHREEGPPKGLFTGSQGEWVIVGPKTSPTGEAENKDEEKEKQSETDCEKMKDTKKSVGGD